MQQLSLSIDNFTIWFATGPKAILAPFGHVRCCGCTPKRGFGSSACTLTSALFTRLVMDTYCCAILGLGLA